MNLKEIIRRVRNAFIPYSNTRARFYGRNVAGVSVTNESAMTLAAVYRAVSYISDMLMVLPWNVFEQGENFSSVRRRHSLDWILNQQINSELDARQWRSTMLRYALTRGNAFAEIARDNRGAVTQLGYPIQPELVNLYRSSETNELFYRVWLNESFMNTDNGFVDIPADFMYHLKGPGDGYMGWSVIGYAARSLGIGLAQESNVSSFFANGSKTSGVLEYPGIMPPETRDNLSKYLEEQMQGPSNAFNLLVLEQGMKWNQIGIPNDDAQMLQSREFTVLDVARFFNLPPYVLQDYSRATWNNIEHASTEAVLSGLLPWAVRMETQANIKLIAQQNQRRLRTRINLKGLLRADTSTRNEAYAKGRQWGWLSANDVRALEDLEPIEGGDIYLTPMNMNPVGQEGQAEQAQGENNGRMAYAMVEQMWEGFISREIRELEKRQGKQPGNLCDWLSNWHDRSIGYYLKTMGNLLQVLNAGGLFYAGDVNDLIMRYTDESITSLREAEKTNDIQAYMLAKDAYVHALTEETIDLVEAAS